MSIHQLTKPAQAIVLPEKDQELLGRMIDGWRNRRVGSKRNLEKTFKRDVSVIEDLVLFAGKAPWYWTEEIFEKWCMEIGLKRKRRNSNRHGLSVATQRLYQGVVRRYLEYIVNNVGLRNEVRQQYGIDMVQICTSENCIPHVNERELSQERPAFTHEQIAKFFDAIEMGIVEAAKFSDKALKCLLRDKAMFGSTYYGGFRASETLGLNVGSFSPNPKVPEFGNFGFVSVWGKGSKGSGPRHGTVPVTHTDFPPLMDWYIKDVRPLFLRDADPNEEALFLSERGKRLSLSGFEARFQRCLSLAGLGGLGLVPHSLRHSSGTHEAMRMSTEAVRRKLRHKHASTTQGYMHVPDEFVADEIDDAIRDSLDLALKEKK